MTGQCKSNRNQAGKQLHVLTQTLFLGLSKSLTWKKTTDEWALSVNGVRRTELSCRTVPVVLKHTLWHLNNDTHIKAQSIFTSICSPPVKKERTAFERLLLVWSTQTRNETLRKKESKCEIPEGINLLDIQWTQRSTSETVFKFCV